MSGTFHVNFDFTSKGEPVMLILILLEKGYWEDVSYMIACKSRFHYC
jgi:hypothetical protein